MSLFWPNDRLSAHAGGIIMDISQRACRERKFPRRGKAKVTLEIMTFKIPRRNTLAVATASTG
jgi:hypothetical protein